MSKRKNKKSKSRQRRRQEPRPEDCHLFMGPTEKPDSELWRASVDRDAVADREWLLQHPEAEYRQRLASPLEIAMSGCPPGTIVRTSRGPCGSQIRALLAPGPPPAGPELN